MIPVYFQLKKKTPLDHRHRHRWWIKTLFGTKQWYLNTGRLDTQSKGIGISARYQYPQILKEVFGYGYNPNNNTLIYQQNQNTPLWHIPEFKDRYMTALSQGMMIGRSISLSINPLHQSLMFAFNTGSVSWQDSWLSPTSSGLLPIFWIFIKTGHWYVWFVLFLKPFKTCFFKESKTKHIRKKRKKLL